MRYCLNAETTLGDRKFRLNNQLKWVICENSNFIDSEDLVTFTSKEIESHQKEDFQFEYKDEKFEVDPEMGYSFGVSGPIQLHYTVYSYPESFPTTPDFSQLESLLLAGNDSIRNTLVLMDSGMFQLVPDNFFWQSKVKADVILRFEGFNGGNNFVGQSLNNTKGKKFIQTLFKKSLHQWIKYLNDFEVQGQEEITIEDDEMIDEIIELHSQINEIRTHWKAL